MDNVEKNTSSHFVDVQIKFKHRCRWVWIAQERHLRSRRNVGWLEWDRLCHRDHSHLHKSTSGFMLMDPVIWICRSGKGCRGPRSFCTARYPVNSNDANVQLFLTYHLCSCQHRGIDLDRVKTMRDPFSVNGNTNDSDRLGIDFDGIYPPHIYFGSCNDRCDRGEPIVWKNRHN